MRFDLQLIGSWIEPGARVLDLGCGEGDLLRYLKKHKQVDGTGIEKDEDQVARGIARGLSVLQGDINREILDFPEQHFDCVVLSRTLQQVFDPDQLLRSMLRIGKTGIISFPNFSHWQVRLQLLVGGYAPVTRQLPYQWYDTPNIRVITLKDFERFAFEVGFEVIRSAAVNTRNQDQAGKLVTLLPNLRATYGIFQIKSLNRSERP
ncbi:MAG: methionine biosynthesis protein MetW [Deltaproteobacteria bacterium]|nr:methionine biosynthesis protein MetW [Deltaproteobacteria bacterium]